MQCESSGVLGDSVEETMLGTAMLATVAKQITSGSVVELDGKSIPIRRTGSLRLKTLAFMMNGRKYQAIEQNPKKPIRSGAIGEEAP